MKKNLLLILLGFIIVACGSREKPKGFEMQQDIDDDFAIADSVDYDDIYISGSKPIDSLDPNKLIYDIFRLEIEDYPNEIRLFTRVYDSLGYFATQMADPYKQDPDITYFTKIDEELGKLYKKRMVNVPEFTVREYGAGDSIPYNLMLTIDYSGSMEPVLDIIHMGTNMLIDEKYSYDNIGISSFNNKFDLKVPMDNDTSRLRQLFNAKKDQNKGLFSAMRNAVVENIKLLSTTSKDDPRVLVLFTDGDDNYSKIDIGKVIEYAKKENVHIFTVAFGYSQDQELVYLARYTGGRFYRAKSKQELLAIIRDIYNSLRQYYLISYKPPEYWGYHTVFSELTIPGRDSNMVAIDHYDTSDLFPWSDFGDIFKRPILFEYNKSDLLPQSEPILNEIVDAMMSKPTIRLEVQGHTDNIGGEEFNQLLSERRAKAVMDALISKGIEERRLRYRGFGYSQPEVSNDTEQGRAQNRRTMFKVTAK
ncbi:MAG: OmpA family protein [Ignavibacteriae bacterium]|nr:OmpA family protein [Ignavibacteriota bacterium]